MKDDKCHPIQVVAARTGLSQHAIRAWERRYRAVVPGRTATNRRMYSDHDIARLRLLMRAKKRGRTVGQIAHLSNEDLLVLLEGSAGPDIGTPGRAAAELLEEARLAVQTLAGERLEEVLEEADVSLSQIRVIQDVVAPLIEEIGEKWRTGQLRVAHEHLASGALRGYLTRVRTALRPSEPAPTVVVATPSGQWHELGALMVAAIAAIDGWKVTYLGSNLPAEDIAAAARIVNARAVALSIVYPADDPLLSEELRRLRRMLPNDTRILVGGRAADAYAPALGDIAAVVLNELALFRESLEDARYAVS